MNVELRKELLQMIAEDARVREELAADGSLFEGYHPWMEEVHRRNTAALRRIIAEHGWPGIEIAGADGEEAAWRIAQHSIGEPEFMRNVLQMLKEAATVQQAPLYQVAMMEDRIRMFEGRLQLYGTSFDWSDEERLAPYPEIERAEEVDQRRAQMGLPPLEEDIRRHNANGEEPPVDLNERRQRMIAWAIKAGWRND